LNCAAGIVEKIRIYVGRSNIKFRDKELKVTISCGVATWPASKSTNSSELISDSDRALYFAKEHGRNQVIIFNGTDFSRL
ncbi:MAG: diguanylate cyclase, partial [Deltaproteobacteria bacterium]|nr:diguanylate cyclase [Deltaproteobacteria bacterium]